MRKSILKIDKELSKPILLSFFRFLAVVFGSRRMGILMNNLVSRFMAGQDVEELDCEERYIPSRNGGTDIRVRIYKPKNMTGELPGMLYSHGGGLKTGLPEQSSGFFKKYIETRPCIIVAPDYRKSLQHPYPAAFNDCYDTLLWMRDNAKALNMHPNNFILAGHSAGGGLTATMSVKARDTKDVDIAFQIPCYPMLDYKQNTASVLNMTSTPVLNRDDVKVSWDFYLENVKGEISPYASASVNTDYNGIPPTISFVGEIDPLLDETIEYINALKKAKIPVKFETYKGAYHGFEAIIPKAKVSIQANKFQYDAFAEYYDKYILGKK